MRQPSLSLAESAVAVDNRGNLLQWGAGYDDAEQTRGAPTVTLRGKNITRVAATVDKIFALSKSGVIYVLPADRARQSLPAPAGTPSAQMESVWWWPFGASDSGCDCVALSTDAPLRSGERFTSLSAGRDHLLALTSAGRAFSLPLNLRANRHGQLGVREDVPLSSDGGKSVQPVSLVPQGFDADDDEAELAIQAVQAGPRPFGALSRYEGLVASRSIPSAWLDNPLSGEGKQSRLLTPEETEVAQARAAEEYALMSISPAERDIRFAPKLLEIPALRGIPIAAVAAGERHSMALTTDERVLAWGSNGYGQLGLGPLLNFPVIPTPIEVPLAKSFAKDNRIACTKIAAGGNTSYFVVARMDRKTGARVVELVSTGHGQFGENGNGTVRQYCCDRADRAVESSGLAGARQDDQRSAGMCVQVLARHS